jgi:hypothetical protein
MAASAGGCIGYKYYHVTNNGVVCYQIGGWNCTVCVS